MNAGAPHRSIRCAASHAPAVHDRVAAVRTTPEIVALTPRHSWSANGTYASAPENAKVRSPRRRTAAGNPRAARSVPAGVRRPNVGTPTRSPTGTRTATSTIESLVRPARSNAAPADRRIAYGSRRRAVDAAASDATAADGCSAGTARSAGTVSATASATNGSSPMNTIRQPNSSATVPERAGPMTPGSTHAVDVVANIFGRSDSGMLRPIAT